uniref:Uncharacterized protein n=1 Tax=Marmota marmota marmota TaxID=9994 RepID=A0A8C6ER63_MARMA
MLGNHTSIKPPKNTCTFYLFVFATGSHYVAQVSLELLGSSNPPDSASPIDRTIGAGITGVCLCTQQEFILKYFQVSKLC